MNNRLTALLAILICSAAFACRRQQQTKASVPQPPTDYVSEQHEVVSAVVREIYATGPTRTIVIDNPDRCPSQEPSPEPKVDELRQEIETHAFEHLSDAGAATIDDFHARVKECHPLARNLDIPIEYELLGQKELGRLFPKNAGYEKFHAKYPQSPGTINFSNPGFNGDYTQAVISTGLFCGPRCGRGYLVLLIKDNGTWKIKTKVDTWIS